MIHRLDALARAARLRWAVFASHCDGDGSTYIVTLTRPGGGITPFSGPDIEAVIARAEAWLRRKTSTGAFVRGPWWHWRFLPACPAKLPVSAAIRELRSARSGRKASLRFGSWWWSFPGKPALLPSFSQYRSDWRTEWRRRRKTEESS